MVEGAGADLLGESFAAALRATATAAPGTRPGQVRLGLRSRLGPLLESVPPVEQATLRARIHHVVVAAEEHVPSILSSADPLTATGLRRVAAELADKRGWTPDVALRATNDWAVALDVEIQPSSQPPVTGASGVPA